MLAKPRGTHGKTIEHYIEQIFFIKLFWHDYCFSFCLFFFYSTTFLARLFSAPLFFLHNFLGATVSPRLFLGRLFLARLFWHDFFCAVASWLVRSTPDRVVRVRGLAGDIVLCSWARHFTLTVPLSTHVYKWIPA